MQKWKKVVTRDEKKIGENEFKNIWTELPIDFNFSSIKPTIGNERNANT